MTNNVTPRKNQKEPKKTQNDVVIQALNKYGPFLDLRNQNGGRQDMTERQEEMDKVCVSVKVM